MIRRIKPGRYNRLEPAARKLIHTLAVLFSVTLITFFMVSLMPQDAAYTLAGPDATLEDVEQIREELGLDRPMAVQYLHWLARVLQGDLGDSLFNHGPVLSVILSRLPVTLELMVLSVTISLCLSLPLGILTAHKQDRFLDRTVGVIAFSLMSLPVFAMGIVLIYLFAICLHWLPASGFTPLSMGILNNLKSMALPALTVALVEWVSLMRVLRSDMIATLQEDFILTARSKGLPPAHILVGHALRPSSLGLVTLLGLQMGHLMGGAMIVETIFGLPGIGRLFINAVFSGDTAMVQGCVLFTTLFYVLINLCVDGLYLLLDPRIRSARIGNRERRA